MIELLPSPRSDGSSAQDSTDYEHELGVKSKQNVCTWCASVAVTDPMYRSSDFVITYPAPSSATLQISTIQGQHT